MAVTKEEVAEAIQLCRREVDRELMKLHEQDRENAWTEEKAAQVAKCAADMAVKRITDQFYMTVGKKTIATIGVIVVVTFITFKDAVAEWLTKLKL